MNRTARTVVIGTASWPVVATLMFMNMLRSQDWTTFTLWAIAFVASTVAAVSIHRRLRRWIEAHTALSEEQQS